MGYQIQKRRGRPIGTPVFEPLDDDKVMIFNHWLDADGRRQERFLVITHREGMIVDVQGCRTRREAENFARRRPAPATG